MSNHSGVVSQLQSRMVIDRAPQSPLQRRYQAVRQQTMALAGPSFGKYLSRAGVISSRYFMSVT